MNRRAFTLLELLAVLVIILIVSAVALPTVLSALSHRQVSEGARILQAQLAGARDAAIRDNSLSGIRLISDPITPNAFNRFIPLSQPPSYSDGLVSIIPANAPYPATVLLGTQALVLEEQVLTTVNGIALPNNPTSWFWNVRLGDKIQINNAGPWLTVCGPVVNQNPEGFVNVGAPGTLGPLGHDYLLLTNGYDDNQNGWTDEGWDGVDNNLAYELANGLPQLTDDPLEWEQEVWLGSMASGVSGAPYRIIRRPMPGINARAVVLPSNVVIDVSRSRLPVVNGTLDIIVTSNGNMAPSLPYTTPASLTLASRFFQFWLAERSDLGAFNAATPPVYVQSTPVGTWYLVTANGSTGRISVTEQPDVVTGLISAMQGDQ
jgi:prepilin-type N-terminal cleavage/methylation domain-containing protein